MERRPMLAGNWKMHKTMTEAIHLAVRMKYVCESLDDRDVVLCPPYTSLRPVAETVSDSPIEVGAQNMHHKDTGAYTGEISPPMVEDTGATWVILGHSERRQYFGEDEEIIARKIRAAINQGLSIFYCIGETEDQRERGEVEEVLTHQLEGALSEFAADSFEDEVDLVVAYEPIWAIGTGTSATPEQAGEAHQQVRDCLAGIYNESFASSTRIVYGGSVKPHNVQEIMAQTQVDGALVGSASLEADDFAPIVFYDGQEEIELPPSEM